MAIVVNNLLILHCPKTGGKWIEKVLPMAGVDSRRVNLHESRDIMGVRGYGPQYFRAAFVRHPYDWYWSYWCFQKDRNWTEIPEIPMSCCQNAEFGRFVAAAVDRFPGALSRLYEKYTGPVDDPIDWVGRTEHIVEDLARLLTRCNIPHNPEALRLCGATNVNGRAKLDFRPKDPVYRRLIEWSERAAMDRFYPAHEQSE